MIETQVFRLSRTEMARLTSAEYIRSYWFFVVPVPIIGLIALITTHGPMQAAGMIAILWPFSIPARSVLFSAKSSRLFTNGCTVQATSEAITFLGEYHEGKRLRFVLDMARIRDVVPRGDLLIIRSRYPGLIPIKAMAFKSAEDLKAFVELVSANAGAHRSDEAPTEPSPTDPAA